MNQEELESLKYPIGKFKNPTEITDNLIQSWIQTLENLPKKLQVLTSKLNDNQLDTPYRPEGWTIRQVVHHIGDSHTNAYMRFKLALTEDNPTIRPYDEQAWAELFDTKTAPISLSLMFIDILHTKLVYLLKGLDEVQLNRTFYHPASQTNVTVKKNIGLYAWHSEHHFAHIENLVKRMNW